MPKTWIQTQNEPINAMKKLPLKLAASRHIRDDTGLTFYNITGNQQSGKTAFGFHILSELYNYDEETIISQVAMSAKDFAQKISDALEGNFRHRCIMWDDMSVSGSAATWMSDPKFVKALAGLGDTLGVATKSVILTSPSGDMIKAFREYSKYKITIHNGSGKYGRVARGYFFGKSPLDQKYCSSVFEDKYDIRIPFYERYAVMRKEISIKAATELMKLTNEHNNPEEIPHKLSIKEKVFELRRDWEAGVFQKLPFKTVCKAHNIKYQTAMNYL